MYLKVGVGDKYARVFRIGCVRLIAFMAQNMINTVVKSEDTYDAMLTFIQEK